jgi:hypothetical protein
MLCAVYVRYEFILFTIEKGGIMRLFTSPKLGVVLTGLLLVTGNAFAHGSKGAVGHSATLSFPTGVADLSSDSMAKLKDIVAKVGADNIERIELAVWSDKAFPKTGDDLSKADRELADKRADKIEEFLKDSLKVSDVKDYNMAETSNWLAKAFRTDDAELKSIFAKEANAPLNREEFNLIAEEGGPSKAVAVVIMEKGGRLMDSTSGYRRDDSSMQRVPTGTTGTTTNGTRHMGPNSTGSATDNSGGSAEDRSGK